MKYYEYKFTLTEGVNPYNTHAITTHLFGKNRTELFSASSSGNTMVIRSEKSLDIPNGKLVINHFGRRCIAMIEDVNTGVVPEAESFNIEVELSYGRKANGKTFCPVWKSGMDLNALSSIMYNNGLELVSVDFATPGVAVTDKKVHIYNIFKLSAVVKINDKEKWNKAFVGGIGQRISYGFGQVLVK